MGEEFYAVIKLVSGEEIMSLVMTDDNDGDPIVVLQNPITMKTVQNKDTFYIKVKPWMEMSDDDFFIIKLDKIITITETKDKKIIEIYNNYIMGSNEYEINNTSEMTGKVKPSQKMGYLSSVKDARDTLEKIFNNTDNQSL